MNTVGVVPSNPCAYRFIKIVRCCFDMHLIPSWYSYPHQRTSVSYSSDLHYQFLFNLVIRMKGSASKVDSYVKSAYDSTYDCLFSL